MKELTMEALPEHIPAVTDFVNTALNELGCSDRVRMQFAIAIDELFSNIAYYAYQPKTGLVTVQVEVENEPPTVILTFLDGGKPFNPLQQKDPDTTLPAKDRKIGGLGIFIVKNTMDDIRYEYKDGKNILSIRKKL